MKPILKLLLILLVFPFGLARGQSFETIRQLVLEETDEVLLSSPRFQDVTNAEILVTDQETHRVLVYDQQGNLINHFGRFGRGPGDLEVPKSVVKLASGNFLVSEFKGRVSKFDSQGNFITVTNTGIPRLNTLKVLPNGKVLLVGGMTTPDDHYLLHLFDPTTMEVEKEFFLLPFDPSEYAMQPLTLSEPSYAVVCQDKIVAAHAMLPELFYFDINGTRINDVEVQSELFSPMEKLSTPSSPKRTVEAYGSASWISGLYCLKNGAILIQFYQNLKMSENPLAVMMTDKNGKLLREETNSPQFMFSHLGTDTLHIRDKDSDHLNTFLKVKIIRE